MCSPSALQPCGRVRVRGPGPRLEDFLRGLLFVLVSRARGLQSSTAGTHERTTSWGHDSRDTDPSPDRKHARPFIPFRSLPEPGSFWETPALIYAADTTDQHSGSPTRAWTRRRREPTTPRSVSAQLANHAARQVRQTSATQPPSFEGGQGFAVHAMQQQQQQQCMHARTSARVARQKKSAGSSHQSPRRIKRCVDRSRRTQ